MLVFFFFWWQIFRHFVKNILEQVFLFCCKFCVFLEIVLPKLALQYERVLNIFLLSYIEYHQNMAKYTYG